MSLKLLTRNGRTFLCPGAATLFFAMALFSQERPWYVTPCQIMQNPQLYTETLVSVQGLVTYGQGEFLMHGYDCADEHGALRLEFGGQPLDPKDRFRVSRERLENSAVPLKKDADYDTLQKLLDQVSGSSGPRMLRATLTGRLFVGPVKGSTKNKSGDSHPDVRLVISDVELVSSELEDPVDFSPLRALPKPVKGCTTSELPLSSRDEEDRLQRKSLEDEFAYLHDPNQVALRAIGDFEKTPISELGSGLRSQAQAQASATYGWTSADGATSYSVLVVRPYWLLQTAVSGDNVIWVPRQVVRTVCVTQAKAEDHKPVH